MGEKHLLQAVIFLLLFGTFLYSHCVQNPVITSLEILRPANHSAILHKHHGILSLTVFDSDIFLHKKIEYGFCLRSRIYRSHASDNPQPTLLYENCALEMFDDFFLFGKDNHTVHSELVLYHKSPQNVICRVMLVNPCCQLKEGTPTRVPPDAAAMQRFLDYHQHTYVLASQRVLQVPFPNYAPEQKSTPEQKLAAFLANETPGIKVLVAIKTARLNVHLRMAFRHTWRRQLPLLHQSLLLPPFSTSFLPLFLVGKSPTVDEATENLWREQRDFGDLLLEEALPVEDSYYTLTDKILEFLDWIFLRVRPGLQEFVSSQEKKRYILICDDDTFIDVLNLAWYLHTSAPAQQLYAGEVLSTRFRRTFKPQRDPLHRNYLPETLYPDNELPPFALGNFYLLSSDLGDSLARNLSRLRPVGTLEDVSMAVWLKDLQVNPVHLPGVCDLSRCAYDRKLFRDVYEKDNIGISPEFLLLAISGLKETAHFDKFHSLIQQRNDVLYQRRHLSKETNIEDMPGFFGSWQSAMVDALNFIWTQSLYETAPYKSETDARHYDQEASLANPHRATSAKSEAPTYQVLVVLESLTWSEYNALWVHWACWQQEDVYVEFLTSSRESSPQLLQSLADCGLPLRYLDRSGLATVDRRLDDSQKDLTWDALPAETRLLVRYLTTFSLLLMAVPSQLVSSGGNISPSKGIGLDGFDADIHFLLKLSGSSSPVCAILEISDLLQPSQATTEKTVSYAICTGLGTERACIASTNESGIVESWLTLHSKQFPHQLPDPSVGRRAAQYLRYQLLSLLISDQASAKTSTRASLKFVNELREYPSQSLIGSTLIISHRPILLGVHSLYSLTLVRSLLRRQLPSVGFENIYLLDTDGLRGEFLASWESSGGSNESLVIRQFVDRQRQTLKSRVFRYHDHPSMSSSRTEPLSSTELSSLQATDKLFLLSPLDCNELDGQGRILWTRRCELFFVALQELMETNSSAHDCNVLVSGEAVDLSSLRPTPRPGTSLEQRPRFDLFLLSFSEPSKLPIHGELVWNRGDNDLSSIIVEQTSHEVPRSMVIYVPYIVAFFWEMRSTPTSPRPPHPLDLLQRCMEGFYGISVGPSGKVDRGSRERTKVLELKDAPDVESSPESLLQPGMAYLYWKCNPLREAVYKAFEKRYLEYCQANASLIEAYGSIYSNHRCPHKMAPLGRCPMSHLGNDRGNESQSNDSPTILSRRASRYTQGYQIEAMRLFSRFRLVLAMENTRTDGYITEKLGLPFLAGAIPVYYGAPDVGRLFNDAAFIDCGAWDFIEQCVDHVVNLYFNHTSASSYLSQSLLKGEDKEAQFKLWSILFAPFEVSLGTPASARFSKRFQQFLTKLLSP